MPHSFIMSHIRSGSLQLNHLHGGIGHLSAKIWYYSDSIAVIEESRRWLCLGYLSLLGKSQINWWMNQKNSKSQLQNGRWWSDWIRQANIEAPGHLKSIVARPIMAYCSKWGEVAWLWFPVRSRCLSPTKGCAEIQPWPSSWPCTLWLWFISIKTQLRLQLFQVSETLVKILEINVYFASNLALILGIRCM